MLMTTTPGGSEPPRNDMSPTDMPPVCCGDLAPCTPANAGIAEAATDAAPRLRRKDLRERPELIAWLMDRLLNINLENRYDAATEQKQVLLQISEFFLKGRGRSQICDRMSTKLHQIYGQCHPSIPNSREILYPH